MKKYRVNVNGTVFEVEIEEMTGEPAAPAAAPAPAAPGALRRRRNLRGCHQGGLRGVRHPAVHHRLTPEGRIWKQLPIS